MIPVVVKPEFDPIGSVAHFQGSGAVAMLTQGCALGWYVKPLRGRRFVVVTAAK